MKTAQDLFDLAVNPESDDKNRHSIGLTKTEAEALCALLREKYFLAPSMSEDHFHSEPGRYMVQWHDDVELSDEEADA